MNNAYSKKTDVLEMWTASKQPISEALLYSLVRMRVKVGNMLPVCTVKHQLITILTNRGVQNTSLTTKIVFH